MSLIGVRKVPIISTGAGPTLLEQVLALGPTALYDISDLSSLFSDRSATPSTPASVDGVVGTVLDLSGNSNHLVSPSDGARPTLRQSGGYTYLEFNGSSHYMKVDFPDVSQPDTIFISFKNGAVSSTATLVSSGDVSQTQVILQIAGLDNYFAASPSGRDTGFPAVTDVAIVQFNVNNTSSIFRYNGADSSVLSTGTDSLSGLTLAARYDDTQFFNGFVYGLGIIAKELSSAEKSIVDQWLASLNGVSI